MKNPKLVEKIKKTLLEVNDKISTPHLGEEALNTDSIITLLCSEHGEIKQSAGNIIYGKCTCKKCSMSKANTLRKRRLKDIPQLEKILELFSAEEPERAYQAKDAVSLVCDAHGPFSCTLKTMIRQKIVKCPKCSKENNSCKIPFSEYVSRMKDKYDGKYTYKSNLGFPNSHDYITAICSKHGGWEVRIHNHIHSNTECPKCSKTVSRGSAELTEVIKRIKPEVLEEFNVSGKRADNYIPSLKIAIEYNGLYYHSSAFKDKYEHQKRRELFENNGIRMVTIWADELGQEKTIKYLENLLGKSQVVFARKCQLVDVPAKIAIKFFNENHLMGSGLQCPEYVGLEHEGNLVACMGFKKGFHKENELYRAVFLSGIRVIGGFSKMLKSWHAKNPGRVISYIDLDKFDGRSYYASGFKLDKITLSMFYCYRETRISRHSLKKEELKKYDNYSEDKTEKQILEEKNIFQCWNSGTARVILE